ncbi:MAG: hypothetical protein KG003_11500 [Bacteroidetes bacterium]|nr:hypothetical protein [Bacteroidota bacterium]
MIRQKSPAYGGRFETNTFLKKKLPIQENPKSQLLKPVSLSAKNASGLIQESRHYKMQIKNNLPGDSQMVSKKLPLNKHAKKGIRQVGSGIGVLFFGLLIFVPFVETTIGLFAFIIVILTTAILLFSGFENAIKALVELDKNHLRQRGVAMAIFALLTPILILMLLLFFSI